MKFILGTKLDMTQVFRDSGQVVPVTRVQAGPCVVTQVKTEAKDGVRAVQVGFGIQKKFRLRKPQQGHLRDLTTLRVLRDFKTEQELQRGDMFTVNTFSPGEKVQVVGQSKGKGFQGVVKRHGFAGSPASHGHKDQLRMPGSIGATDPARVFKGTRMGGHMGDQQVTVKNLEIVAVDPEKNELLIKGALPGARGGLVLISTLDGTIEVETVSAPAQDQTTPSEPVVDVDVASDSSSDDQAPVSEDAPKTEAPPTHKEVDSPNEAEAASQADSTAPASDTVKEETKNETTAPAAGEAPAKDEPTA